MIHLGSVHTAGKYMIQHHTKQCSPGIILTRFADCKSAKTALDPSAGAVKIESNKNTPKGCSRSRGRWFFNTADRGTLDGESQPVCKASTGEPNNRTILVHTQIECTLFIRDFAS